jgi:hypothetical protein
MRLLLLLAAGGAAYYFYNQRRKMGATGSTTNASDAMDNIGVPADAGTEEHIDAGVKETFPASDPISVTSQGETEWERQQRRK